MNVSPARENILKKIRQALAQPAPVPFPQSEGSDAVFRDLQQEPEIEFAEKFTALEGRFSFCADAAELAAQLNTLAVTRNWNNIYCRDENLVQLLRQHGFDRFTTTSLYDCDASITGCEQLIARTGSMVLSAAQPEGRTISVYAPVHICIAYTSQLVYDIRDALQAVREKYTEENWPSIVTLASGPSRTADIEKTLVVGVHGPKEVFCFLMEG